MKITRMMLRLWGACYSDEKIASLVPESGLTPIEIAQLNISVKDKLWVLLREDIVPARELRLLACDWAEEACRVTGWDDVHSMAAISVSRRFAVGEATEFELVDARLAIKAWAWAATMSAEAGRTAAWAVAWSSATEAAAEASAWAATAAREVARSAAASAGLAEADAESSWEAAWEAVLSAQLADVLRVLKG